MAEDREREESSRECELALFRERWVEELEQRASARDGVIGERSKDSEAADLYWMGAAAERNGDMGGAVMYYRQAMQLVPDIEFRASSMRPSHSASEDEGEGEGEGERGDTELLVAFPTLSLDTHCPPDTTPVDTHISSLPVDVLRYILRWVVSSHLDMRSLERVSMVCRGLYVLARDSGLWRLACRRIWKECSVVGSWRSMFINSPHLFYDGIYISKISYIRPGERSLDLYYKPYHTVVYYRYLRFFPNGSVLYLTSPEEPGVVVGQMQQALAHSDALCHGYHSLTGTEVRVVVAAPHCSPHRKHFKRGKVEAAYKRRFHLDLELRQKGRGVFSKLVWQGHCCSTLYRDTGHSVLNHFTIDYKYTPFHFSRVKSYSATSHHPLT